MLGYPLRYREVLPPINQPQIYLQGILVLTGYQDNVVLQLVELNIHYNNFYKL